MSWNFWRFERGEGCGGLDVVLDRDRTAHIDDDNDGRSNLTVSVGRNMTCVFEVKDCFVIKVYRVRVCLISGTGLGRSSETNWTKS